LICGEKRDKSLSHSFIKEKEKEKEKEI